jgi:predicted Zn-dependent protease
MAGLAAACCRPLPAAAVDERAIGYEVFSSLREDGEILFDSPYYERLNETGQIIADTARERYPFPVRYLVVKGDSANAFSVPGGNIYVNEPLLMLTSNRDELAGVLAHETGHMVLHHVARKIANANILGTIGAIGSAAASIFLGPLGGYAAEEALGVASQAQDANVSRHIEAQADEEGARIMAATGDFNPYGMIWFFEKMIKEYGDTGTYWQRSHPFSSARITDLRHLFAANPAVFGKYKDTNAVNEIYW